MLNRWNPQRTDIDGVAVHFFEVRSPEPGARPVVMTHGWPGSVIASASSARGGHFAALEQPALFVQEVRAGFRAIRASLTG